MIGSRSMTRPIGPMFFIGVFLLIVIAAVLMLSAVIGRDPSPTPANSEPREALARQLQLLKHGDAKALRGTLAPEVRSEATDQVVRSAQAAYADVTLDTLVGRIDVTGDGDQRTAQAWRPDGALLTGMALVNGQWVMDTVWFR